jgi:hypothetical protein
MHDEAEFPPAGSVIVFPLGDGRLGAARVLRVGVPKFSERLGALMALSEWIGSAPPTLDEPLLLKIQHLTHHAWKNVPQILWTFELPPLEWNVLGIVLSQTGDTELDSEMHGSLKNLPVQRLLQWRWENDREALLVEEAALFGKRKKGKT